MIKVTIVDDNQEVRNALEKLITNTEGFELTGSYSDPDEAIAALIAAFSGHSSGSQSVEPGA